MLLGDVVRFGNGKSIKPGGSGAYPVYGSNGIIGGSDEFRHEKGIIIGRVGAYCGSVAYCSGRFWASDNTLVAFPASERFDTNFIYYLLRDAELSRYAGGAAQPLVTQTVLKRVRVCVPPLPVQRQIAGILSAYDDLIENNTRRIRILEEMARAIYREWFVDFRFPGYQRVRMVDSPMGKIPEGWEAVTLGDLCGEVRRGIQPSEVDPETPYFGLEHLPRKSIALSDWGKAKDVQSTKLAFKKGEILFGKIRPYFHKVGVAPVDGVCSSDAIVIVPKSTGVFGVVLSCVSGEPFVAHATRTSQGTKMPRANWDVLVQYPMALPPKPLLGQFNDLVAGVVRQIQNMIFRIRNLRQTRDLLLAKLISGEVDVSELDIKTGGNGR
jgi:type I restriction enzyme S subunit